MLDRPLRSARRKSPKTRPQTRRNRQVVFVVAGGKAYLSGLEDVGTPASAPLELALPDGRYAVRVTIIDWDREPGARGPDGRPTSTALPDFVVQVGPAHGSETYRTNELTFDSPD